jgi:hypothetical protein
LSKKQILMWNLLVMGCPQSSKNLKISKTSRVTTPMMSQKTILQIHPQTTCLPSLRLFQAVTKSPKLHQRSKRSQNSPKILKTRTWLSWHSQILCLEMMTLQLLLRLIQKT